jgi:hypothetical protein
MYTVLKESKDTIDFALEGRQRGRKENKLIQKPSKYA